MSTQGLRGSVETDLDLEGEHRPQMREHTPMRRRGVARRVIAMLSMAALSLGLISVTAGTAQAANAGIAIDVLHKGQVVGSNATVPEGDGIQLRVQYDAKQSIAGEKITISLPPSITVNGQLPGNAAVESMLANPDGTITVTFANPIPEDVTEGAFVINLTAEQVDHETPSPISWTIGDDKGGVNLVVENVEPPVVEVPDSYHKGVQPSNLNDYMRIAGAPDYEFLGLKPTIADQVLTYTLVLGSAQARTGYEIADLLGDGLAYVSNSFVTTLTTVNGTAAHDFTPVITGNAFSGTVDVPAQSTLRISYEVKVTDVQALEQLLHERFTDRHNQPGDYSVTLANEVTFGGTESRSAQVSLSGNIPGVGVGDNFAKRGNWTLQDVLTDDQGNLSPAAEMDYVLHADLTPWDKRNPNFTLHRNVVISDTLIEQASWRTGPGFISVAGAGPIVALSEAAGFSGTAEDFAATAYVGKFALVGNQLLINVGQDNTTDIDITVRAQLDTVAGLAAGTSTVVGGTQFPWNNRASFTYADGVTVDREHNAAVVELPEDYESGVNDSAAFNKTTASDEVRVNPGERAQIPYRFTIDTAKPQIDPLHSKIVDEVDTSVFDISDLSTIPVTGSYGGTALAQEHFAVSTDSAGKLVIELSDAGKNLVAAQDAGQKWIVDITLTTVTFTGKETFEIYNRASLLGEKSDWDYWSDQKSEATSFGDEAEMRKRIYDTETGSWVSNLDALIEHGEFVAPRFVYSIELIPRGNYGQQFPVTIFTRQDVLPSSVEFLGFVDVDAAGVPNDQVLAENEIELNGNVVVDYAAGAVTIRQKPGTNLDPNQGRVIAYFAVEGNDTSQPIVNTIAGSTATIYPVGDPSISIVKWSDEGEQPEYDASGALLNDGFEGDFDKAPGKELAAGARQKITFTISNDGRESLRDIQVKDQVLAGDAKLMDLVCEFPDGTTGTEWSGNFEIGTQFECVGTLQGVAVGAKHSDRASVTAVGAHSGKKVDDADVWNAFVAPAPAAPGSSGLVNTGGTSLWWLGGVAVALLAAGSAVVWRTRKTRDAS